MERSFTVTFKENRTFELYIGRKPYRISPKGSITLTGKEINHSDFKRQSDYFVVKED